MATNLQASREIRKEAEAAVGAFIMASSLLEAALHVVLHEHLRLDPKIEGLLVGEPRMGDLITLVKKAAEFASLQDDLRQLLAEICEVASQNNKVRQVVAHKPCIVSESWVLFHNTVTAKSDAARYMYRCTSKQLGNQAKLVTEAALTLVRSVSEPPLDAAGIRMHNERLASLKSNPLPAIPSPPPPPKLPKQPRQPKASQP